MSEAPLPAAVVFDLDGTLVDTADDFIPVVQQLQAENDMAPTAPERIRQSVSNGARALVCLGLKLEPEDPMVEVHRLRLLELYERVLGQHARLYTGMAQLLRRLETQQIPWGIATNKPRAYTVPLLQTLGLAPGSVTCPDDVAQPKPHPEALWLACRQLDCEPAASVYVGDHRRDIQAGRAAGMRTVAAAYGYLEPGDDADAWGADALARCSTEVEACLFSI